jgi:hypothetical protein
MPEPLGLVLIAANRRELLRGNPDDKNQKAVRRPTSRRAPSPKSAKPAKRRKPQALDFAGGKGRRGEIVDVIGGVQS